MEQVDRVLIVLPTIVPNLKIISIQIGKIGSKQIIMSKVKINL